MKKYCAEKKDIKKSKSNLLTNFKAKNVHLKTSRGRNLSSANWLRRHMNDSFVQMANEQGFLSRAAYKIIEIFEKYPELKKSKNILDLGCSPGSWSQAINEILDYNCKITGVDLLESKYMSQNFRFILGDFEDNQIQNEITINSSKFDLIVSDIAHNAIGNRDTDRTINIRNLESCLSIIDKFLDDGSWFITKTLYGSDQLILQELKSRFEIVKRFKPKSSRKESTEIYLICIKKKEG